MQIHTLLEKKSLLNNFLVQLRDVNIQSDSMRFRRNLERIGEIMAYEISKVLDYQTISVETPLGEANTEIHKDQIVIATILRAGIPFHNGFLNYFDDAQNAFVSSYRKYSKDGTFTVKVEYVSSCDLSDKILILVDPMLATGESLVRSYNALVESSGKPKHTHIATIVASEEGLEHTKKSIAASDATIWCGAIDEELTVKSYIVPGIGDVGDLAYGDKL